VELVLQALDMARPAVGHQEILDPGEVFYVEAAAHDTLVRTARRTVYRSTRRLRDLEARLPNPPTRGRCIARRR
jgi:DNA-binding LytR/AlgR family response regulator